MRPNPYIVYLALRAGIGAAQVFAITSITFALSRVSGNPLTLYLQPTTPAAAIPVIERQYHLNDPEYVQFYYYIVGALHGNLGVSRSTGLPVTKTMEILFPWSLELALGAIILSFAIGIPVGIYAGWKKGKIFDSVASIFATLEIAVPQIVIGLALILLFFFLPISHGLPYLPSSGGVSQIVALDHPLQTVTGIPLLDSLITGNLAYFQSNLAHLVLPMITLSLFPIGFLVNTVRSNTAEVLNEDFVLYLRSLGTPWRHILFKHVLKHNLIYLITVAGLLLSSLIGGAAVVETIFSWPGIGLWAANSILSLDTAGILGFVIMVSLAFIITNFVADTLHHIVDKRVTS